MPEKLLSIIVPIYNEAAVIERSLPAIFQLPINKEVIVVNDGSTDDTARLLDALKKDHDFRLISQPRNLGKGAAVRRGLLEIKGDYFIICDADLEYDPSDILKIFSQTKLLNGELEAYYGSRFLARRPRTIHYLFNRFITGLANLLFNVRLTDIETCYKLIPATALKKLCLRANGFAIDPELTTQLLKMKYRINEYPVSYTPRSRREGKKIRLTDGFLAIATIIREKIIS